MRAGAKGRRRSEGSTGSDRELLFVYYRGRLYDLGWYPGVVPSDDPADLVRGELFALPSAAAPLLAELDRYEGPEFSRVCAPVTLADASAVESWIYLYTREVNGLPRIASGDFLA
jgi:gamma-glutamylcyclotransferase (GGCT)/AIG2-like uncharacterized protein YtfP